MELLHTLPSSSERCMFLIQTPCASIMYFNQRTWDFFSLSLVEERLEHWKTAAKGPWFRIPTDWTYKNRELLVELPSLPHGYQSFSLLSEHPFRDKEKIKLVANLCEALTQLHKEDIFLGFILPEFLYFHPETLHVVIDVQPFPSAYPFLNNLLPDYDFRFFSRYARRYTYERISDFHSIGLLLQWMFTGDLGDQNPILEALPAFIRELIERLITAPGSFLFVEEIIDSLQFLLGEPPVEHRPVVVTHQKWLHPMAPPISQTDLEVLRCFLRSTEKRLIGLICEDEATRYLVISEHFNEVLEQQVTFAVACRNLPFATLREAIERTIAFAMRLLPHAASKLRSLERKLERLLQVHNEGTKIIQSLTNWLVSLFTEILPMFEVQSFYYYFEGCEYFDEDSQKVFLNFWQQYGNNMPCLHALFSGAELPALFASTAITTLTINNTEEDLYQRVILSQLGRADSFLLSQLTNWMIENNLEHRHSRMILQELVEKKYIQITSEEWKVTPSFTLDIELLSPQRLLDKRISYLSQTELDLLRIYSCLSMPIRMRELFIQNGIDPNDYRSFLVKLSRLGLLQSLYENSVFVTHEVASHVLHELPTKQQKSFYKKALSLQLNYNPNDLPTLIELSMLSGNSRSEYWFLIKYYREIRALLSLEQRKSILENIKQLQQVLARQRVLCWDRLLYQINFRLNQFAAAERLGFSLYQRTGRDADRFRWLRILMYTNRVHLPSFKQELLDYISSDNHDLNDRIYAGFLLTLMDTFIPLHRDGADLLHEFYVKNFYPNRHLVSTRLFADFTISYTIVSFQYFPEREEWSCALLTKLESILEKSAHHDLMIELYNCYIFHSNLRLAQKYNQHCLETSQRYGYTTKQQICHLNGMEIAVYQGDLSSYRYHLEMAPLVDEFKRTDLREQMVLHQLLYTVEYEQWEHFDKLNALLSEQELTDSTSYLWQLYIRYAAYQTGKPLPLPMEHKQTDSLTLLINGLYAAQAKTIEEACCFFEESIKVNEYRFPTGWAYRELIALLLSSDQFVRAEHWLNRFEEYVKRYSYDVFWPDFFRLSANLAIKVGDNQQSMLLLRRAINGYQLIEKENWHKQLSEKLQQVVQPSFASENHALHQDSYVQQLLKERNQLLDHSLDLSIIIQLSELVTESLDLTVTFQRLTHALFEYFPVTHVGVTLHLFHRQEKAFYTASGLIETNELLNYHRNKLDDEKYKYTLYKQGNQYITLEVYVQNLVETKKQHMEHFLSFIKPHIANSLLYLEMMIDNLTGFYQRRYFLATLKNEWDISQKYGLDLSLVMLDVDDFRLVNEHGHQEGDKVLSEISDIVRSVLRKNDIPGRYGGEELLLILPKTDGNDALKIAEKLRLQIEEEFVGHPYEVTVSVGVSSLELCFAQSVDELIRLADDAEIKAKTTGKNRVVAAWS